MPLDQNEIIDDSTPESGSISIKSSTKVAAITAPPINSNLCIGSNVYNPLISADWESLDNNTDFFYTKNLHRKD